MIDKNDHLTDWNTVIETMVNSRRVSLVFNFEFVLAGFSVSSRKDIRYQFVVLPILRQSLVTCKVHSKKQRTKATYIIE